MSSYLMIKHAGGTKSIEAKTAEPAKPYIKVADGYFPLTTETSGTGVFVKASGSTYKIAESYTTTVTNSRTYKTTLRTYTESKMHTAVIGSVTALDNDRETYKGQLKISMNRDYFYSTYDLGNRITFEDIDVYGIFTMPNSVLSTLSTRNTFGYYEFAVSSKSASTVKYSSGTNSLGIFMGCLKPEHYNQTYYQSYFDYLTGFAIHNNMFNSVNNNTNGYSTSIELKPARTLIIKQTSKKLGSTAYSWYYEMEDHLVSVRNMAEVDTHTSYETITTTSQ